MERDVVKRIRAALAARGAWTIKIHGSIFQPRGTPDIIGCIQGRLFAFEVKEDPNEPPDDLQAYNLGLIRAAGGIVATVYSADDALSVLRNAEVIDGLSEVDSVDSRST